MSRSLRWLAAVLAFDATALAETPAAPSASERTSPAVGAVASQRIEHDGQTFELATCSAAKNVVTDEYVLAGEKIGTWTQLLTVQRLTLGRSTGTDEFVSYFGTRLAEDGATLEALNQTAQASVFAVHFPKSEQTEEQVMICLAFTDPEKPLQLNVVQYAIKPTRLPLEQVTDRIRSWRDRFVRQAQSISARG